MKHLIQAILLLLAFWWSTSESLAQGLAKQRPRAYALIVGSNAAGDGQETLRFAESDAKEVAAVLGELGNYQFAKSGLLIAPNAAEFWARFSEIEASLEKDRLAGRESAFFLYYSGHARSQAIDLGKERVLLAQLRSRIEALPADLRIVVLDACQSGAISGIKGATPATDFSSNSISGLRMKGLAIMASSTSNELSQESEKLRAGYFTHHLLTGLRGAADGDSDGSVSLAEAYRYAYDSTLLATAMSAVGKQHVTLETDLSGKGDLTLTRPKGASAQLQLPKAFAGTLTISRSKKVVAEISKAKGGASLIALSPGSYQVLLRTQEGTGKRCNATLSKGRTTQINTGLCASVTLSSTLTKGPQAQVSSVAPGKPVSRGLSLEVNLGWRPRPESEFRERLETFRYKDQAGAHGVGQLKALYNLSGGLSVLGSFGIVDTDRYTRRTDGASDFEFSWSTSTLMAGLRYQEKFWGTLHPFAELALGSARSSSTLLEVGENDSSQKSQYGLALAGSAGILGMLGSRFGLLGSVEYSLSQGLENEIGDKHSAAGVVYRMGLHISL